MPLFSHYRFNFSICSRVVKRSTGLLMMINQMWITSLFKCHKLCFIMIKKWQFICSIKFRNFGKRDLANEWPSVLNNKWVVSYIKQRVIRGILTAELADRAQWRRWHHFASYRRLHVHQTRDVRATSDFWRFSRVDYLVYLCPLTRQESLIGRSAV